MPKSDHEITSLLDQYQNGNLKALDGIFHGLYGELLSIARRQFREARNSNTLTPNALVNELYLRLKKRKPLFLKDRRAFYSAVGTCMRQLLIDYSREKKAAKRGGKAVRVTLNEEILGASASMDLESLNGALEKLAKLDPELSKIVELRYLVGLSIKETAEALDISLTKVKEDWATAQAWLAREISRREAA